MIKIYTTSWCAPCKAAKSLLNDKNIKFEEIDIEKNNMSREDLAKITGGHTVPQIIINEKCIGGFTELLTLNQSGELDRMLSNEN
tara:strand:- start:503 stop:757 length:255 start_codon:yes stop_codon:yes gene_type:complete